MHPLKPLSTLAFVASLSSSGLLAGPITIDGNWADWGINPGAGDWSESVGSRIFYENYLGTDGTAFVGPGYGGQYFDLEAIYATRDGNMLNFAIVGGFDPDGVMYDGDLYQSGDIFFNTGSGWNSAVDLQTGKVFTNAVSNLPTYHTSAPFTIVSGNEVGTAQLYVPSDGNVTVYTGAPSSHHYFIEGALDLALIGGENTGTGIHWTMSCGNDVAEGTFTQPVPEPATCALLLVGASSVVLTRRRLKTRG